MLDSELFFNWWAMYTLLYQKLCTVRFWTSFSWWELYRTVRMCYLELEIEHISSGLCVWSSDTLQLMHFAIYPYAAPETGWAADRGSWLSVKKDEILYEKKNEMRVLILWHVPKQVSQWPLTESARYLSNTNFGNGHVISVKWGDRKSLRFFLRSNL